MKISVIIPFFDSSRDLALTLESLKSQRFRSFEAIITDCTGGAVANEAAAQSGLKDINVIKLGTANAAQARNIGISAAKGKYLAFLTVGDCYSKSFLASMYDTAERYSAQLTVGKMHSRDEFGVHKFSSAKALSKRGLTDRFDTDLIWNPSLSNKLFLKSTLDSSGLSLYECGDVQEAVFSLSFALGCDSIACCSKGYIQHITRSFDIDDADLSGFEDYIQGYELIMKEAMKRFDAGIKGAKTDFERKELRRQKDEYADALVLKELTILLYRYYRHIHFLSPEQTKQVTDTVMRISALMSEDAFKGFLNVNSDIFVDGVLASSTSELLEHPRFTVAIQGVADKEALDALLSSVFCQTLPAFELIIDEMLKPLISDLYSGRECISFISSASPSEFRQEALECARAKYILFIDEPCLLDPKALQRNYRVLKHNRRIGFTTTPLARHTNSAVQEYSFCSASFFENFEATSIAGTPLFALDLFLSNKFFKVSHLKGIKFSFSDSAVLDAYTLYRHSSFQKLSHHCVYLTRSEGSLVATLNSSRKLLPPECAEVYDKIKKLCRRRRAKHRVSVFFKTVKRKADESRIKSTYTVLKTGNLKKRAVFCITGDSQTLSENMKAVYDAVGDVSKHIITQNEYERMPHRTMRLMLTSRVIITDGRLDFLRRFKLREDQFILQLWNSAGAFKRFGLDSITGTSRIEEMKLHSQYSAVCVTSPDCRQYYSHAFGIPKERILALGRPDTDRLISKAGRKSLEDKILRKHPILKDKRIYLYCPTYREADGHKIRFEPEIDWTELANSLEDDEMIIIHRHPIMREDLLRSRFYSNIKDYTNEPLSELLSVSDVLITDYSSAMFDAVLMDIPVVFYCPDIKNYSRDFYLRYPADLPGEATENSSELLSLIRNAAENCESEKAQQFKERMLCSCDGHSAARVAALILSKMGIENEK